MIPAMKHNVDSKLQYSSHVLCRSSLGLSKNMCHVKCYWRCLILLDAPFQMLLAQGHSVGIGCAISSIAGAGQQ
jgi:hypothetical protein